MMPLYAKEQLYHFDGKLYKIDNNDSKNLNITLVWQRDEKSYQKERKRLCKQLFELMVKND